MTSWDPVEWPMITTILMPLYSSVSDKDKAKGDTYHPLPVCDPLKLLSRVHPYPDYSSRNRRMSWSSGAAP